MVARLALRACAIALCVSVGFGCGDDDDGVMADAGPDGGGRDGSVAGLGGRGGRGGGDSSGSGGRGGSSGTTADAGATYQCEEPAAEAGGSATEGQGCCGSLGVCTKNPSGPAAGAYGLSECKAGAQLKCVPLAGTGDEDAGSAVPPKCRASLPGAETGSPDYEGRCVPSCFLSGDRTAANLSRSGCATDSRCVPCFSPITGESTGACNQPGDAPADPNPGAFAACGDANTGLCVPAGLVAAAAGSLMLPQLTCEDGFVCAPKISVLTPGSCFAHCTSPLGGPGACVAGFVVPASSRGLLTQTTCSEGELCVPCVNPIDPMRARTGACD